MPGKDYAVTNSGTNSQVRPCLLSKLIERGSTIVLATTALAQTLTDPAAMRITIPTGKSLMSSMSNKVVMGRTTIPIRMGVRTTMMGKENPRIRRLAETMALAMRKEIAGLALESWLASV